MLLLQSQLCMQHQPDYQCIVLRALNNLGLRLDSGPFLPFPPIFDWHLQYLLLGGRLCTACMYVSLDEGQWIFCSSWAESFFIIPVTSAEWMDWWGEDVLFFQHIGPSKQNNEFFIVTCFFNMKYNYFWNVYANILSCKGHLKQTDAMPSTTKNMPIFSHLLLTSVLKGTKAKRIKIPYFFTLLPPSLVSLTAISDIYLHIPSYMFSAAYASLLFYRWNQWKAAFPHTLERKRG